MWQDHVTGNPTGLVNLVGVFGVDPDAAAYACAEVNLAKAQDLNLKIGSNHGVKCWVNGEDVGGFDALRLYQSDQNTLKAVGKKGVNRIVLKISGMAPISAFSVRLTDADDKPLNLWKLGD